MGIEEMWEAQLFWQFFKTSPDHVLLGESELWPTQVSTIPHSLRLKLIPDSVPSLELRSDLLLKVGKSCPNLISRITVVYSFIPFFYFRKECAKVGIHTVNFAGIAACQSGAYSICLSGGYEDDKDDGETLYINWNTHFPRVLTACFFFQCLYWYRWSLSDSHRVSLTDSFDVLF